MKAPHMPGCYLFRDSGGRVIYIGKAKNLHKRIASYFSGKLDPKTKAMVESFRDFEFIVTDSEVEALILENNLIKRHQPKYNISLKDSKRYACIEMTAERFPRLLIARKRGRGRLFGPFTSAAERDSVLATARKLFQLRTCRKMPKKPCLRYHIKLCTAPCAGMVSEKEYCSQAEKAAKLLSGNAKSLIAELKEEMTAASDAREYERALKLRDQAGSLSYLLKKQKMERQKEYDEDIINFLTGDFVYLMVFNIHRGMLVNRKEFSFSPKPDWLSEFLVQYYSENKVPKELILPVQPEAAAAGFLEKLRGRKVRITVPRKGEKRQLLDLVRKNIEVTFFGDMNKTEALQKRLGLHDTPRIVECFDISHTSGTCVAGSMVQFRNGRPWKDGYRRFRIRTAGMADDYQAIAEVVRRRYARLLSLNTGMPDLIIIDGGRGQLNSALAELSRLGLRIPAISIAKKSEEIYLPGSRFALRLPHKDPALLFVRQIRDEAHRFALKYNRVLRRSALSK